MNEPWTLPPLTDEEIESWKNYHGPLDADTDVDTSCICGEYYDECEPAKLLATIVHLQSQLKRVQTNGVL